MRSIALAVAAVMLASPAWARDADWTVMDFLSVQPSTALLAAPGPLSARTSSNRVSLTWSNVKSETGFLIERRRHGAKSFSEIAKTTADLTSLTDILTSVEHFEYRVRAYKVGGGFIYSPYTNTAYSTTPCD